MRQQLEEPEAPVHQKVGGPRTMGINWIDSKREVPVSVNVLETPAKRQDTPRRARWQTLQNLIWQMPVHVVMFGFVLVLFCVYWISCLGQTVGSRLKKLAGNKKAGHFSRYLGMTLLIALAIGFSGCVGYVGPDDGYGAAYVGPDFYGPDLYVFGGYGGHYHGHFHEFAHRGAVSRGFHGGGGQHR